VAPDGRLVATGSATGKVQLWSVDRAQPSILGQHASEVRGLEFSPDGRLLASVAHDFGVRLWSIPTRELVATLGRGIEPTGAIAFSPDGSTLAFAACQPGRGCSLFAHDVSTGEDRVVVDTLRGPTQIHASEDGQDWLVVDVADQGSELHRISNDGEQDHVLSVPEERRLDPVIAVAFRGGAGPVRVATGRVRGDTTNLEVFHFDGDGHGDRLLLAENLRGLASVGRTVVAQDEERTIAWDIGSDAIVVFAPGDAAIRGAVLSPDGTRLAVLAPDEDRIVHLESGETREAVLGGGPAVWGESLVVVDEAELGFFADEVPDEPEELLAWLREQTDVRVPER
jgi:WD40 repeat protein